jgi:hypothetical protein
MAIGQRHQRRRPPADLLLDVHETSSVVYCVGTQGRDRDAQMRNARMLAVIAVNVPTFKGRILAE